MKYYAIADLHGRYDLLEKAMDTIYDREKDTPESYYKIITLGDYIDRGQRSRDVIQGLMKLQEEVPNLICLKGNHEDIMLQTIRDNLDPDWWFGNGGEATVKSYGAKRDGRFYQYAVNVVSQDHLNWVEKLPLYYETPRHVFVHAGVQSDDPLEGQDPERLMWMLYDKNDSGGWQEKHVVHGHHIHIDGPHEWEFRTALDTGSYYTGRQVIGVFDDSQGKAIEFIEINEDDPHTHP